MRIRLLVSSLAVIVACDSSATPSAPPDEAAPRPVPSEIGSLIIVPDSGALVVGRRLRVVISGSGSGGLPFDASYAEVTSSNPSVAQFAGASAVPITVPPTANLNALVATFDLNAVGSTAIRARLGILTDSIVISVVPPT